jgi:hypothetical protein
LAKGFQGGPLRRDRGDHDLGGQEPNLFVKWFIPSGCNTATEAHILLLNSPLDPRIYNPLDLNREENGDRQ